MKVLFFVLFCVTCMCSQTSSSKGDKLLPLPAFSYTQGWLGADDAYSVSVAKNTSVWLFGDTFAGNKDTKLLSKATTMVRNSVGVSICKSGAQCTMQYYWQKPYSAKPRSFFDTGTDALWYWPLDGYFDGKSLYVQKAPENAIDRVDLATGHREHVATFGEKLPAGCLYTGPAIVAANGRAYAYTYVASEADLYTISGLR